MAEKEYTCIIVDDEPIATRIIKGYVHKLDYFEVKGIFHNALDSMEFLRNHSVNLVFLDIQMPGITGLEFIKSLKNPPSVIFTTAFREYAVDAFDLNAIDYLVKPISFDRFLQGVNKFMDQGSSDSQDKGEPGFIILKSDKKNYKTYHKDIRYIESLDDYIKVHTKNHTLVCYLRLSGILENLPSDNFIRIHRSFIINTDYVTAFTTAQVELGELKLTIGRNYRDMVQEILNQ